MSVPDLDPTAASPMLRRTDPTIPPAEYPELTYGQTRALVEDLDGHPGARQVTEVPVPGGRAAQGQPARGGARTAGAGPAGTRSRLRGGHPGGHHRVPPAGSSALLRRGGAGACVQSDRRAPAPCSAPGRWRWPGIGAGSGGAGGSAGSTWTNRRLCRRWPPECRPGTSRRRRCSWTLGVRMRGARHREVEAVRPADPGDSVLYQGNASLDTNSAQASPDGMVIKRPPASSSSPDSTASGASSQRRCGWGRPTGTCATAGTGGGHPRAGLRQRPPGRGTARHRLGRPGRRPGAKRGGVTTSGRLRCGRAPARVPCCCGLSRGLCAPLSPYPGPLAQLAEQRTFNPLVLGSSPRRPTLSDQRFCVVDQVP